MENKQKNFNINLVYNWFPVRVGLVCQLCFFSFNYPCCSMMNLEFPYQRIFKSKQKGIEIIQFQTKHTSMDKGLTSFLVEIFPRLRNISESVICCAFFNVIVFLCKQVWFSLPQAHKQLRPKFCQVLFYQSIVTFSACLLTFVLQVHSASVPGRKFPTSRTSCKSEDMTSNHIECSTWACSGTLVSVQLVVKHENM